jgi:predicted acetyltransferase
LNFTFTTSVNWSRWTLGTIAVTGTRAFLSFGPITLDCHFWRLDGKLVGFALVTQGSEPFGDSEAWDMAEFFVLRRYRHRGIGTQLAEKV